MPVTSAVHDTEDLSLTITAEFAAPVERIWEIYADPRQLERIWGPPTYPATVEEHDLSPGGRVHYFMTSPEGEKHYGWWKIIEVDAPKRFTFEDGFADETYAHQEHMPTSFSEFTFESIEGGTRAVFKATYDSVATLERVIEMGAIEGGTMAINQIDDFVAG